MCVTHYYINVILFDIRKRQNIEAGQHYRDSVQRNHTLTKGVIPNLEHILVYLTLCTVTYLNVVN